MATGRLPDPNSSPLTAKGDLYTYSTVPAKLAVGNNGETLVADSSATTGLRWTGTLSASNPVINGGMDIWQRGTSFTSASVPFTADRWQCGRQASQANATFTRQTTSDTTNLPFIQYSLRAQRDSGNASTNQLYVYQNLESVNSIPYAGRTVTLSFYARAGANYSPTSSLLNAQLITGTGTDQNALTGSFTGAATPINTNVTLTTTWQRFQASATLSSTMTQIAIAYQMTPTGTASTNDWFEVTGVQIDVGSVALPFRRSGNTLAGELAACQRYFQSLNGSWSTYGATGDLLANYYRHQVQMRTAPTVTITTNPTYTNASALTNDENTVTGSRFYATVTTTGRAFATNFIYSASSEL